MFSVSLLMSKNQLNYNISRLKLQFIKLLIAIQKHNTIIFVCKKQWNLCIKKCMLKYNVQCINFNIYPPMLHLQKKN